MVRTENTLESLLELTRRHLSDIKPSDWYEQNMVMPAGSAFPGKFSFDQTPYWREPLDCLSPMHPATHISIMKSAQSGGSAAVLNPIVGYTISQNPGNMMFLTGHAELSDNAFLKIDQLIDNCGLRDLIGSTIQRKNSTRTGDTGKTKEYPGGSLIGGSVTNHNLLRQYDIKIMIVDDFDAAPMSSKAAGNTRALVDQRTAAFARKKKIFYVSSPQLKGSSNIESVFLQGDQRYYYVPCPICAVPIVLKWKIDLDERETAGITWKLDSHGHLDRSSVGYVCQECSGFFTDRHKYEINLSGEWKPTVIPKEENHFSYQLSALYAPTFMDDWATLVQKYITAEASPDDKLMQTFVNVNLGETYEKKGKTTEAETIQRNVRNYDVDVIPEFRALKDGSGGIVLLTCACDMNGKVEDARLDYEIVGWAKNGARYSIRHGSIGTFVPGEGRMKVKSDRERWTYESTGRSVWPALEDILKTEWVKDTGGKMKIVLTGLDCGHYTTYAYAFIDGTNHRVVGVRGDKEHQARKEGIDTPIFKPSRERPKLYMLDVNHIKDIIANIMELKWQYGKGESMPSEFMNFPMPSQGMYLFQNYFEHYKAEHRIIEQKDGLIASSRWVKVNSNAQNHMFDVAVYNYALREIWADMVLRANKPPIKGNWADFIKLGEANKIF